MRRFFAGSLTSIHCVTLKVLSMMTFANALSNASQNSNNSANNGVTSVSSQSTTSNITGEGACPGPSKDSTVNKRRKGSLISEVAGKTVEEVVSSDLQFQTIIKPSRHQNSSLSRGKGNSEGTETLKKSSSAKM